MAQSGEQESSIQTESGGKKAPAYLIWTALSLVLLAAVALRVLDFPARYEIRDVDEVGYTQGSLALFEGITPGYAAAPGGTQFWTGWLYVATQSLENLLRPKGPAVGAPWELRGFYAVDRSLFDDYRNLSGIRRFELLIISLLSLVACIAAFYYGETKAGLPGAIFCGGLLAATPLFVRYACMARPYSLGWSFGVMAVAAAACRRSRWRAGLCGIFLGLAVASRIEMVCLIPLALWEFWDAPTPRGTLRPAIAALAIAIFVSLAISPWPATHFLGELRTIATVRFGSPDAGKISIMTSVYQIFVVNGLLLALVPAGLFAAWVFRSESSGRRRRAVLAAYVALLSAVAFKATGFGLHQQGPSLIVFILAGGIGLVVIAERRPKLATIAALLAVAPGLCIASEVAYAQRTSYVPSHAVGWLETHAPAGALVYVCGPMLRVPLPTPQASARLWGEVTDANAWRRKFASGLRRFHLKAGGMPRALSEANMIQERGDRRGWFILGGEGWRRTPRFNIHIVRGSPVFGVRDLKKTFLHTGGILLWAKPDKPPTWLPHPTVEWINKAGIGRYIFEIPPPLVKQNK